MENNNSYRQIFRATGLFGSIQILTIIFSIIRNKSIALLMGANGIGLIGMFTSAITLISSITSFGFGSSSVKIISEARATNHNLTKSIYIIRKLSFVLGFFGLLVTIIFSKVFGNIFFGANNYIHTYYFLGLSLAIFFMSWESGETAILQGLRELSKIAKANVLSSALGLIFSLPMFYYWGIYGLVPSLVVVYFFNAIVNYFYSKKAISSNFRTKIYNELDLVRSVLKLGFAMSLSSILVYFVMVLIRIYISKYGNLLNLGYYQAAFGILNGYVGMIFNAMAKDYYPRLSEINSDNYLCKKISNEQIELGLLIILPIIALLIVFLPTVIVLLYTRDFLVIKYLMYWALLGIPFKMISWSLSYVILSKGDIKSFLTYEITGNIIILLSNILFYFLFGLIGLGYAFLFSNILYLIIVLFLTKKKYSIGLNKEILIFFFISIISFGILILINCNLNGFALYLSNSIIILSIIIYSVFNLARKLRFQSYLLSKINFIK